jgi:hypothetical protein
MMQRGLARLAAIFAVTMLLGSCSYAYEITVTAKNGRMVFTIGSSGFFGSRTPYVNYVDVEQIGKPTKRVWMLETTRPNGPEMHELRYGEVPAGMKSTLGPSPLVIGQLYRVTFFTIDGGGYCEFAISDDAKCAIFVAETAHSNSTMT